MLPFTTEELYVFYCSFLNFGGMPRVVPDQRLRFEQDELFRKLSLESEVRYCGHRERILPERRILFQDECRSNSFSDIAFNNIGITFHLLFEDTPWIEKRKDDQNTTRDSVDFDTEPGRVKLKSRFVFNGVCVQWRGYIDLEKLEGVAKLEFDSERAEVENQMLHEQLQQYNTLIQNVPQVLESTQAEISCV